MRLLLSFFLLFLGTSLWSQETKTRVTSAQALYDGKELLLTGHVNVTNALGNLYADSALLVRDESGQSDLEFPWIYLRKSVLVHLNDGSLLKCHHVAMDLIRWSSTFESEGALEQVYYKEPMGEVFADRAVIDYLPLQGKIEPQKITLLGHVVLRRLCPHSAFQQYACADMVEIYLLEERMTLRSEGRDPVLFFDTEKEMQLSAASITAQRKEGKESVRGEGNVQFIFAQSELERLQKRFNRS